MENGKVKELNITKEDLDKNTVLIILDGKLIYDTEDDVRIAFEESFKENKNIIVDMRNLKYINSSGLGIFVTLLKKMKTNEK
jgi:anti-sigma B factor antagonist